jgi:hypothetical protein
VASRGYSPGVAGSGRPAERQRIACPSHGLHKGSLIAKMSFYEAEGVIESAKEPAAELIQEIANIGVGEILRIAIEETAFGLIGDN